MENVGLINSKMDTKALQQANYDEEFPPLKSAATCRSKTAMNTRMQHNDTKIENRDVDTMSMSLDELKKIPVKNRGRAETCLLYTSPSPRDS